MSSCLEFGGQANRADSVVLTWEAMEQDDMYMYVKNALPIYSNPGMIFPQEHFADEDAHLKFAARLISGIMDYKLVIDA